jgi:hypothetical protein
VSRQQGEFHILFAVAGSYEILIENLIFEHFKKNFNRSLPLSCGLIPAQSMTNSCQSLALICKKPGQAV